MKKIIGDTAAEKILRPWGKREREGPLRVKQAENLQDLETDL